MAQEILATKLHPPKPLPWWVARERPSTRLDKGRKGPVTVVSAPAGYGKSTCVAAWLASRDEPSAWLTLEASDDELVAFVSYLIAAVRTAFPEACPETQALLDAVEIPPAAALARRLANELDTIQTPFILVLDDYQAIEQTAVHDLLAGLLAHPPHSLRLVVISRRDPPLPMASLRARGQLAELRLADLQFDRSESDHFIAQSTGLSLSERSLAHLYGLLEGWPVGLHLFSLALRTQEDPEAFVHDLRGTTYQLQEYLLEEVVAGLPAVQQRWLFHTSVLDRFNAELCDALCAETGDRAGDLDGKAFIETLHANNLFTITLDERREWHRYHHTFQGLLQDRLERLRSADEIRSLHARAAGWLDEHDLPGEALHHALAAADYELVRKVVYQHHNTLVNGQEWNRLERWLGRVPESISEADPALQVAQAWSCEYRFRSCAAEHLRQAEQLLSAVAHDEPKRAAIQAEIDALHALHEYGSGNAEKALACAERALQGLAPEARGLRAYTIDIEALARQSLGDLQGCLGALHGALESHAADVASRSLLLTGLAYANWLEGDLVGMKRPARQIMRLGEEHGLRSAIPYAGYLLGILHYVQDERPEAAQNLETAIDRHLFASQGEYCHTAFALALTRLSQGQREDAQQLVDSVCEYALEIGDARILELCRAFEAEFDLRLGRQAQALGWARSVSPDSLRNLYMFYVPQLTLAKIWLANGGREDLESSVALLDRLLAQPGLAHNVPVRVQALGIRAVAHAQDDDETAALETLAEALSLAARGGFVRPFADLGAPMASLLERLPPTAAGAEHLERIRAAFRTQTSAADGHGAILSDGSAGLVDPLTNREQDVLELLTQRLRDKEIAEHLVISPGTVKSHLKGLYQKLGVGNRREAVARARKLGILAGESAAR